MDIVKQAETVIYYGNCDALSECSHKSRGQCTRQESCIYKSPNILSRVGFKASTASGEELVRELDEFAVTNPTHEVIHDVCAELARFLCEKNDAYGNSIFDPVRIFSKLPTSEQINVRIDDKLSRLMRGAAAGEDTVRDLAGYLVLKMVHERL